MAEQFGLGHDGEYQVDSLTLPISPTPVRGSKFFRQTAIATTAALVKVDFEGGKNTIRIFETGGLQSLEYSFDGTTVHGTVAAGGSIEFTRMFFDGVWLKNGTGVATVTVEAWVGGLG